MRKDSKKRNDKVYASIGLYILMRLAAPRYSSGIRIQVCRRGYAPICQGRTVGCRYPIGGAGAIAITAVASLGMIMLRDLLDR